MAAKTDNPTINPSPSVPSKPLSAVPTGEAYASLKDDYFRWEVVPLSFGGLAGGSRVGAIHLQPGTNIDLQVARGNLIPLGIDESAEAAVNEHIVKPSYAVVELQPPKPEVGPQSIHTFDDAMKVDDAMKAEEAKKAEELKAKYAAEGKAKWEAEEKARQDAIAKAKADMAGKPAELEKK